MTVPYTNIQKRIKDFDFKGLFTQELMWNHFQAGNLEVRVDSLVYILTPVAQRAMAVYECVPPIDSDFPTYATRRKIDAQVSKSAREHIIIFRDNARTVQVWQWVRREAGKPSACREQFFYNGQSGDALVQKILGITFALEDEPNIAESVAKVGAAFDVERLTKKFYDLFKKEHDAFLKFVNGIPTEHLRRWYVSVMLNRLMFIYFIQKKGFLGGDLNYLTNKLKESKRRGKDKFYRDYLCPLFFEGFAKPLKQRSPEMNRLLGAVPYLNGGLFLKHQIEELHGQAIDIPDKASDGIFAFFDQYDWHLDDRPTKKGNEINPDVLGYVFEKYINQKEMGAYYSKEDITEYISKNAIIPALFGMVEWQKSVWNLLQTDPDRYFHATMLRGITKELPAHIAAGLVDIAKRGDWNKVADADYALPSETWREVVARRARTDDIRRKLTGGEIRCLNDLITFNLDIRRFAEEVIVNCDDPDLVWTLYKALCSLSILDPACGSGAFLFAALNILERLYDTCLVRMQAFVDDLDRSGEKHSPVKFKGMRETLSEMNDKSRHPSPRYFILKTIILRNLYGVDLMEEATEICKLRLFLKLVAQVDKHDEIEPLPDIDFNIRAGNTLVGFASREAVQRAIGSKLAFDNTLEDIEEQAELVETAFERFREMQMKFDQSAGAFSDAKLTLQSRLVKLRSELDGYMAGEYGVKKGDKAGTEKWRKSHDPFHWFVEFYGIMNDGGFDAIIGNPPYVEISDLNGSYSIKNLALTTTGNLYAVFVERFTDLLAQDGRMGIIVPISSISTPRMSELMELVTNSYSPLLISNFAVRPGKLFVGADMNLTIMVGQKATGGGALFTTSYNRWTTECRPFLFDGLHYQKTELNRQLSCIPKAGTNVEVDILKKIAAQTPLGNFRASHSGDRVYYHSGGRYFRKCIPEQLSNEYKELTVEKGLGKPTIALMSSSLYYLYWICISDCYHVTKRDVEFFGMPSALKDDLEIARLADALVADLWKNAETRRRERADGTIQDETNFKVGKSKTLIDSIDRVLARHYKLTPEQLDFVMNYDVKFRMTEVE
jgi:hypothetical protein